MKNPLKEKLRKGEHVIGTFIEMGHPDVTEILSHMGFDWLLIDGEHSPMGFETMERMLQSMSDTNCTPIIRPQWNDPVVIKRILDIGAHGILVPWVNNKEEAETAVEACMYPPKGIRGWGPRRAARWDPEYRETADEEILVSVQIETQTALDNLDGILCVEGIDACYVGPWDLSNNLGLSVPPKYDDPRFAAALDKVVETAEEHGKPAGLFCNIDNVDWATEKGFRYNTVGSVDSFMMFGAKKALERAKP